MFGRGRDQAYQRVIGDFVGVLESAADQRVGRFAIGGLGKHAGIVGRIVEPIGVGVGVGVRGGVAAAIVMDAAPVTAEAQGMRALGPGQVVDDVLDRNVDDGGQRLPGGLVDKAEVDPVTLPVPMPRVE